MSPGRQLCLDDLPNCVLYTLFTYLDSSSLYNLSKLSDRFHDLIVNDRFWRYIDARCPPNDHDKFKFCTERVHKNTHTVLLRGGQKCIHDSKTKLDFYVKIAKFRFLKILALEDQSIDAGKVSMVDLPSTLEELSLRRSRVFSSRNFFKLSSNDMQSLRVLVLDECDWVRSSCFMSLAKYPKLEILSFYNCDFIEDWVSYLSLAFMNGFKRLKILDARLSPLGNTLLHCVARCGTLMAVYLQNKDYSYNLDLCKRQLAICRGAEPRGFRDIKQEPEAVINDIKVPGGGGSGPGASIGGVGNLLACTDDGLMDFLAANGTFEQRSRDDWPQSCLYVDPYDPCRCDKGRRTADRNRRVGESGGVAVGEGNRERPLGDDGHEKEKGTSNDGMDHDGDQGPSNASPASPRNDNDPNTDKNEKSPDTNKKSPIPRDSKDGPSHTSADNSDDDGDSDDDDDGDYAKTLIGKIKHLKEFMSSEAFNQQMYNKPSYIRLCGRSYGNVLEEIAQNPERIIVVDLPSLSRNRRVRVSRADAPTYNITINFNDANNDNGNNGNNGNNANDNGNADGDNNGNNDNNNGGGYNNNNNHNDRDRNIVRGIYITSCRTPPNENAGIGGGPPSSTPSTSSSPSSTWSGHTTGSESDSQKNIDDSDGTKIENKSAPQPGPSQSSSFIDFQYDIGEPQPGPSRVQKQIQTDMPGYGPSSSTPVTANKHIQTENSSDCSDLTSDEESDEPPKKKMRVDKKKAEGAKGKKPPTPKKEVGPPPSNAPPPPPPRPNSDGGASPQPSTSRKSIRIQIEKCLPGPSELWGRQANNAEDPTIGHPRPGPSGNQPDVIPPQQPQNNSNPSTMEAPPGNLMNNSPPFLHDAAAAPPRPPRPSFVPRDQPAFRHILVHHAQPPAAGGAYAEPQLGAPRPPPRHFVPLRRRLRPHELRGAARGGEGEQQPQQQVEEPLVEFFIRVPEKRFKLALEQLSLRGHRSITDNTLRYVKDLDLKLLDLTYTSVTQQGIEEFLTHVPNCRIVHEKYCRCPPNMHI